MQVVKQCVSTDGVEASYIREDILPPFFRNFWVAAGRRVVGCKTSRLQRRTMKRKAWRGLCAVGSSGRLGLIKRM